MQPPEKPPKTGSLIPLSLAGCGTILVGVALVFLTMGFAVPVVAIVGILFAIVAFHYLVWGRWLAAAIREEAEAEERQAQLDKPLTRGAKSHDR